ncbi:MAG: hypothetical protein LBR28_05705, partial [Bacteroidales bacterium]|nr:hypothetical protein [Bacteroidales bacterium]
MIKRLLLFNTLLLTSFFAFSQNIAVEKFYADVTDQSARITDKKTDQNNKVCAIVKIETPLSLSDFSFDAGMIGIEHSEQRTGEVWVWLPSGAQRLTIIHKHLGAVRNYEFGEPLQAGMVYIMKLAGKVTTIVEDAITQQFLVVTCNIEGSTIEIKGYGREAFTNGLFSKLLPFGKYQYQVDAPKYQSSVGSFEITAAGKTQIKIDLIPNFSNVKISADGSIYINEVLKGENNWSGDLVKGSYKLEIKKPSHHTATKVFEVEANKDIVVQAPVPTPMYGKIQINSNVLGSIFIDGKDTKETAPVILDKILAGQHIIKLKADGYK